MKFKTTQKEIRSHYENVICVPYCHLQTLLSHSDPIAYTTRVEGWGADIYEVDSNTCIATGYAPFGNIKPGYALCQKWEMKARNRIYKLQYENRKRSLDIMLKHFVEEAKGDK